MDDHKRGLRLALTSLEAPIGLVDDVNAPLAPNEPVLAMAIAQRAKRVTDFHETCEVFYFYPQNR